MTQRISHSAEGTSPDARSAAHLARLGVPELTEEQAYRFETDGFFIVTDVFDRAQCEAMATAVDELFEAERGSAGAEVSQEAGVSRRLSNLFNKSAAFDPCMAIGPSMAAARHLLGDFRLHGANIREPLRGAGQQPLHSDVPKNRPTDWQLVNTMVAVDEVTLTNGPTRVVPGSHRWSHLNVPVENLYEDDKPTDPRGDQARVPQDPHRPYPGERYVTLPPGAIAVINGHLWHSGTTNIDGTRRRLATISYARRDVPQQISFREVHTPALDARLNDSQRWLLDVG
jgi:Phytanoyl-CoA dioxygenase (PhyH)